jgi:hypothetical protein
MSVAPGNFSLNDFESLYVVATASDSDRPKAARALELLDPDLGSKEYIKNLGLDSTPSPNILGKFSYAGLLLDLESRKDVNNLRKKIMAKAADGAKADGPKAAPMSPAAAQKALAAERQEFRQIKQAADRTTSTGVNFRYSIQDNSRR